MKKQSNSFKDMVSLFADEERLEARRQRVFAQQELSDEEMARMHDICRKVVAEEDKGNAIRAELFALYFLCQPSILFYPVSQNSETVRRYARQYLQLDKRRLSYYRCNLAFLYSNYRQLQACAETCIECVQDMLCFDDETAVAE